jgi:hypothetical protein
MQDTVTRRVQWRWTSNDVDPSTITSALTTASQPNTSPALIFPKTCPSLSPNQEQLCLSPIREKPCWSPIWDQPHRSSIRDQPHWSPIREQPRRSLIREQPRRSQPQTQSTPAPNKMRPKAMKNVRGRSQRQQRRMSSKATTGKQPLQESANPKLPLAIVTSGP